MTIRRCTLSAIAGVLTLALFTGFALAGTTGALRGVVTDQRHAPVAGATVVVTSPAQREQTVTDAAGRFGFISLMPATYAVTIIRREYGTLAIQDVAVSADATTSMVARVSRLFWLIDGMRIRQKALLNSTRTRCRRVRRSRSSLAVCTTSMGRTSTRCISFPA